jgi:hypothetical protein
MQSGVDVGAGAGSREGVLDVEEEDSYSAVVGALCPPAFCLPQLRERSEQWSGDFGIARLGTSLRSIFNISCIPSDVAWDVITSHFLFVLRHPAAQPPIRLQAARTLDYIFAIVPRYALWQLQTDIQEAVQRRVPDVVLSQQIMLGELALSTIVEPRRLGLETLHQILQASPCSSAGKRYSRCSVASAGPPFLTLLHNQPSSSPPGRRRPTPLGYLQERGHSALIKLAFQCMTLMCVRCSRRFFARAPASLHQHACTV